MVRKSPKMGHFMDAPSPWRHFKFYTVTTGNDIKMKLTGIMHLLGRNSQGIRGRKRKTSENNLQNQFYLQILTLSLKYNTNRHISDSLLCIASLANISIELDKLWGKYGEKTSQKQPKTILSTSWKTFEIWKFQNYRSDTHETCPRYVTPEHLHSINVWVRAHTKTRQNIP